MLGNISTCRTSTGSQIFQSSYHKPPPPPPPFSPPYHLQIYCFTRPERIYTHSTKKSVNLSSPSCTRHYYLKECCSIRLNSVWIKHLFQITFHKLLSIFIKASNALKSRRIDDFKRKKCRKFNCLLWSVPDVFDTHRQGLEWNENACSEPGGALHNPDCLLLRCPESLNYKKHDLSNL